MNNTQRSFADKAMRGAIPGEYPGGTQGDDFRARASGRTGFFGPDGQPARGYPAPAPAPVTPKPPTGTGFFTPDGSGSKAFGPQMGMEITGPKPVAPASFWQRATNPANWRSAGQATGEKVGAVPGLGAVAGAAIPVGLEAASMHTDDGGARSKFYDSHEVGGFAKARQAARDMSQMAFPAAGGVIGTAARGVVGAPTGPGAVVSALGGGALGMAAGHYLNRGVQSVLDAVDKMTGGTGQSPLEDFKASQQRVGSGIINPQVAETLAAAKASAGVTAAPADAITKSTFGSEGNPNPFERAATPAAELARQSSNFDKYEGAINNGLAERVKASGGTSFSDGAAQALFNAKQQLNGSGISVAKGSNGTPEFSGNNVSGQGGKLYTAADGSITNDWSKTKNYAEAIQRNKDDQTKLAELTKGAALAGDREAVARLTAGDARLEGVAKQAGTERDLREAVKGGSAKAAAALADMEKAQSAKGLASAELALRAEDIRGRAGLASAELALRAEDIRGRAEDRDLNRAIRQDTVNANRLSNGRAIAKDARDFEVNQNEKLDKQLEQYATFDGKLDGQRLSHLRGLTANLKRSEGQTEEQFAADRSTLLNLDANLENGQAFYDKWFRKDGGAGTDMRRWRTNPGLRGGFTTDQGEHMSTGQFRSLPADQQRMFRELLLKDGK